MRSVGVSLADTVAASGDCRSVIAVWDLPRLALRSTIVLPQDPAVELNAVMDLTFAPATDGVFYVLQRSGHLSLWDVRAPRLRQWHTKCHTGRTSSMKTCQDSVHVVTSSRGSELKLWDVRCMSASNSVRNYVQVYNRHASEKLALGFDFLNYEEFLVTGSDSFFASVYDTLTGRLVQQIPLAPGQVQTVCALDPGSLSFYAVFMNGRYLGVVDTEGPDLLHDFASPEQIKAMYSKDAWDEVYSRNMDRLLEASRAAQQTVPINYDEMLAIVRDSELPICKKLLRDLTSEYEANIRASTPQLVQAFQDFYAKTHHTDLGEMQLDQHSGVAPVLSVVRSERVTLRCNGYGYSSVN